MTGNFSVENTVIDRSDISNKKYFVPKNFPSFLLTDLVPRTVARRGRPDTSCLGHDPRGRAIRNEVLCQLPRPSAGSSDSGAAGDAIEVFLSHSFRDKISSAKLPKRRKELEGCPTVRYRNATAICLMWPGGSARMEAQRQSLN